MGKVRDSGTPPPYGPDLTSRPPPEEQVRFIANIERILSEGSFVATYKYALLVALVDLAIERGDDSSRELTLAVRDFADKFAELYWRQAAPYEAGLLVDRATSVAVAEWSYGHAERVQAEVWLGGREYGHLSAGWRGLLA